MSTSGNWWTGLIDDAATFPPGDADLTTAIEEHRLRRDAAAELVGSFVVRDSDLPGLAGFESPVSIVLTGGASQIGGSLRMADKLGVNVVGLETALRDLDDLAGNARRVTTAVEAAQAEGLLSEKTEVYVEMPGTRVDRAWLDAADELTAIELRLKFRTGGLDASYFPSVDLLTSWIDAALDREAPFKCTAGLHRAVRHTSAQGFEENGFLNLALATLLLFDGDSSGGEVLAERDSGVLLELAGRQDLTRARRWFTSIGSCSVVEPYDELVALGMLSP